MNDWVCTNCKSINRGGASTCYSCGGARTEVEAAADTATAVPPVPAAPAPAMAAAPVAAADGGVGFGALGLQGATPVTAGGPALDASAALAPDGALAPTTPAPTAPATGPALPEHLATGLLAGAVAAILASALWYAVVVVTNYQVGLVAIAVGFLVGQAVVLGAGRRGSPVLVAGSVILTLLALAISEYLIVVHFVGQEFALDGLTIEVIQPIGFIAEVVIESISADPLTLAFWAIALFQAFIIPARTMRGPTAD